MKSSILIILFFLTSQPAMAIDNGNLLVSTGFNMTSDAAGSGALNAGSMSTYLLGIYVRMLPKSFIFLGADFLSGASNQTLDTNNKAKTSYQDVMIGTRINLMKSGLLFFGFSYGFSAKANYDLSSNASVEKWSGTSTLIKFGITSNITEWLYAEIVFNYYKPIYKEQILETANSRTMMFPTIGLSMGF